MKDFLIINKFSTHAKNLQNEFLQRFKNPKESTVDRFIWDYWHVPNQYTSLRTPAYHFFSKKLYQKFHEELVWWGRGNLGCHDISPPWLSVYIDGFGQDLHGDLPHGPWAYVFSLTDWNKRQFSGGETLLLKNEILNYWQKALPRGLEQEDILHSIPPLFNRLTVFDPRVPHGVRVVRGNYDLSKARIVIHGWFVNPRPFIEGRITRSELKKCINGLSKHLQNLFEEGHHVQGVLSVQFSISRLGEVGNLHFLTNVLRETKTGNSVKVITVAVKEFLGTYEFRRQIASSKVTLPLIFEMN